MELYDYFVDTGFALENQSRMFHEFMQFNRNTLQGGGGSGLGLLWICKNLVVLHGGRLVGRYVLHLKNVSNIVIIKSTFDDMGRIFTRKEKAEGLLSR